MMKKRGRSGCRNFYNPSKYQGKERVRQFRGQRFQETVWKEQENFNLQFFLKNESEKKNEEKRNKILLGITSGEKEGGQKSIHVVSPKNESSKSTDKGTRIDFGSIDHSDLIVELKGSGIVEVEVEEKTKKIEEQADENKKKHSKLGYYYDSYCIIQ